MFNTGKILDIYVWFYFLNTFITLNSALQCVTLLGCDFNLPAVLCHQVESKVLPIKRVDQVLNLAVKSDTMMLRYLHVITVQCGHFHVTWIWRPTKRTCVTLSAVEMTDSSVWHSCSPRTDASEHNVAVLHSVTLHFGNYYCWVFVCVVGSVSSMKSGRAGDRTGRKT